MALKNTVPDVRGRPRSGPDILAFDIGGSGLKVALIDADGALLSERLRVATPYPCTPAVMVEALVGLAAPLSGYERIAIGFPGVVRDNRILTAPHFGSAAWAGFDLAQTLSRRCGGYPARLVNDAEMQGLAVVSGLGLELVITLGTGVGTGLFRDGELMPHLELAQHPLRGRRRTYNDYIGERRRRRIGRRRWNRRVGRVVDILYELLHFDRLYIGGGNARRVEPRTLSTLAADAAVGIVSNDAGMQGGAALWRDP